MLKRERATNAFSESKMLSGDDRTYTANVAKATCKHPKPKQHKRQTSLTTQTGKRQHQPSNKQTPQGPLF